MKLLLIGQAPARSAGPETRPWDSKSGQLLAKKMGLTSRQELLDWFETTNLNAELRGTKGKWDLFDEEEAKQVARKIHGTIKDYALVLCAGKRVAEIMGVPLLGWRVTKGGTYLTGIPHPGGTNMWWNNPINKLIGTRHCQTVKQVAERFRGSVEPVRPQTQPALRSGQHRHGGESGRCGDQNCGGDW